MAWCWVVARVVWVVWDDSKGIDPSFSVIDKVNASGLWSAREVSLI